MGQTSKPFFEFLEIVDQEYIYAILPLGSFLEKQGVCHIAALPFNIEKYLKEKEELWKLKYFTMQKYNLQKNPLKETKILQEKKNSVTNLKVSTQAKISYFKNPHIKKIDLLLLPRGQNPLSYYTL